MKTKIISYNLNGIRAALNKGFIAWLEAEQPDILCVQETKAHPGQLDTSIFTKLGYHHFWNSAVKKGYSGVALFSKIQPNQVLYGMNMEKYDIEGRVIRADFKNTTIINVYIPSGTSGDLRQAFKMEFLADFHKYIDHLKKDRPNIIVSGDYNICHKPIDINHPELHKDASGFLPEERQWVDAFVESGFVDTFREFNTEPQKYSWWSYRAQSREKNLGWRIDYHMSTSTLKEKLIRADILKDVFHSDHCPVLVELEMEQ
jgi:exodeoxyribonuclease III